VKLLQNDEPGTPSGGFGDHFTTLFPCRFSVFLPGMLD
jgi:hypothetical protein